MVSKPVQRQRNGAKGKPLTLSTEDLRRLEELSRLMVKKARKDLSPLYAVTDQTLNMMLR